MRLPRFLEKCFDDYKIVEFKEWLEVGKENWIEVWIEPEESKKLYCHRCGTELHVERGKYKQHLEGMPILGFRFLIHFWRRKGHCSHCKKARAELVSFIAEETPHLTQDYAWWLGRLCEIAAVSRVAELVNQDETTTWRLDFARMKRMLVQYKIPTVTHLSVDEVYARKKPKFEGESRDERFFTVISDLKTHRVVWVAESRKKEALDQFFLLLGKDRCKKIEVVATDQHEGYAASIRELCPKATHVLDRFHLMQNFEEAVNETRKDLHQEQAQGSELKRLTRGQYRFVFVKKASRRTEEETRHIDDVLKENQAFAKLEVIKERMLSFFDQQEEDEAKKIFEEIGDWIWQCGFKPLMAWHKEFEKSWQTIRNYFHYRVSSALSEGHNNVIKMLKRRAFGYRNMEYFRLKIMQVCGYLNSRYIPSTNSLTCT